MKTVEANNTGHSVVAESAKRDDDLARLHEFLLHLLERYRAVRDARAAQRRAAPDVPASLIFAEAVLRHLQDGAQRPPQFAVIGPTQTGKSTIVNLLLGGSFASVSPLAGFTVHPQGFEVAPPDAGQVPPARRAAADWTATLFPHGARTPQAALERRRLESWSLELVTPRPEAAALCGCVVWDTPDFDSLAAEAYRDHVLETAALADAHIVVLSKEKYSDLSAWRVLELLEPLGRPMLICLNKMTPDAAEVIAASLRSRLAELTPALAHAPVVQLHYSESPGAASMDGDTANRLRDGAGRLVSLLPAARDDAGARRLVTKHWESWLAPVRAEHAARAAWHALAGAALDALLAAYRRDYLDHPQRFDSFRRATAELLNLLEIPGIGGVLGGIRNTVSWPVRRLVAASKALWSPRGGRGPSGRISSEESVLYDAIDELLLSLQRDAARRQDAAGDDEPFWRSLASRLAAHHGDLRDRFRLAARTHHELFAREIHEAADRLYEHLQKSPATLNALRTARFTGDAASVLLAIKMGGASLNDLIFAPAMFGLVSLLTEGAVGSYMHSVAQELRQRQFEQVRGRLIEAIFRDELARLADGIDETLFRVSAAALQGVEAGRRGWLSAVAASGGAAARTATAAGAREAGLFDAGEGNHA